MKYKKFLAAASAALMVVIAILLFSPCVWAQSTYKTLLHKLKLFAAALILFAVPSHAQNPIQHIVTAAENKIRRMLLPMP